MATNPGIHLNVSPYLQSRFRLAFLTYFRISQSKEPCGYNFSCETRCNVFLIITIISGGVIPVLVPEPVPAIQVS